MTASRGSFPEYLRNAVVASFLLSLCLGFFLPVYTDEVAWRFQERAAFDGVDKMFSDTCGPNTLAVPPFFMWPVRYFSAALNTLFADPIFVRLSGVGYALAWAFLLLRLIRRISENEDQRHALTTIACALMGLGVMPLLLVWSRPEQPILLAAAAAIAVWWKAIQDPSETPLHTAWMRSAGVVLLSMIAVSYHPKGMVLAPVFILCIASASRGRHTNLARIISVALLIGMIAMAAAYWSHRLQCPDDPILNAAYARLNLGLSAIQNAGWLNALMALLGNLNLAKFVTLAAPAIQPMSQWLEPDQVDKTGQTAWRIVLVIAWLAVFLTSLVSFVCAVRKVRRQRAVDWRAAMGLVVFGSTLAWCATQTGRNVYDASFDLPMFMLASLFVLSGSNDEPRLRRGISRLAAALGVLALASQLCVLAIYGPSLARASGQIGFLDKQPNSISVFGYAMAKPDIVGAGGKCGFGGERRASNLVVDEMTYFTFMTSYRPQFQLGVFGVWKGSIADPIAYLRNRGSDGIVVSCRILPQDLLQKARTQGRFCCLSSENW
jgi:hypothetical protein